MQSKRRRKCDPIKAKAARDKFYSKHGYSIYKEYRKNWYLENREDQLEKNRLRYQTNKKRINEYRRVYFNKKRKNDLRFRVIWNLKARFSRVMKKKSDSKAYKLLGCSFNDFKIYIESKFEPGMSWGNYGRGGWEIDHIMPCAIFDLTKPEHQKRCFHFSNLQPLWVSDNRRKHAKIITNQFNLL